MKVSRSHIAWMFSTAKKKSQFFFIILLHDKAIFIRTFKINTIMVADTKEQNFPLQCFRGVLGRHLLCQQNAE